MLARENREWVATEISMSTAVGMSRWTRVSVSWIQKSPWRFGVFGRFVGIGWPLTCGSLM